MFTVFSKGETCQYCVKAKRLLEKAGYTYREEIIGIHILREEFIDRFPDQKTVPLVYDGTDKVGTYEDLVEYIAKKGPAPELILG